MSLFMKIIVFMQGENFRFQGEIRRSESGSDRRDRDNREKRSRRASPFHRAQVPDALRRSSFGMEKNGIFGVGCPESSGSRQPEDQGKTHWL